MARGHLLLVFHIVLATMQAPMANAQLAPGTVGGIRGIRTGENVNASAINTSPQPGSPPVTTPFRYALPDFDPSMLDTFDFSVGTVWESNGGMTPALADGDGVVSAEIPQPISDEARPHHYVMAVNVLDGSGYLFLGRETMSLKEVQAMMNKLYQRIYLALNPETGLGPLIDSQPEHRSDAPENDIEVTIAGNWLTIADIQEQAFRQSRCHVELDVNVYYLAGCER